MATLTGLSEYQKLVDAVGKYYGVGSDQWLRIATSSDIASADWYNILTQTPGVNVVTNNAGQVVSYTVSESYGTAISEVSSAINSNYQAAQMAEASAVNIPANTVVTQAGKTAAESGMKAAATGASVAACVADVAVVTLAVAAGVQAGAAIDSFLYNTNPEFFDSHGMSSLDPQTWDTICSSQLEKDVFNAVCGIDKTTNTTTTYMDEEAFAYVLRYMMSRGAFDIKQFSPGDPIVSGQSISNSDITLMSISDYASMLGRPLSDDVKDLGVSTIGILSGFVNGYPTLAVRMNSSFETYDAEIVSEGPYIASAPNVKGESDISPSIVFYQAPGSSVGNLYLYVSSEDGMIYWGGTAYGNIFSHVTNNLEIRSPLLNVELTQGVEGITNQSGATIPTGLTPGMTNTQALAYLRNLYPDLFDREIYNDVLQPDGTIKRYFYIPIVLPDSLNYNETEEKLEPTGGEQYKQGEDTIDDTVPDERIETLLKILESTNPYIPTDVPPTTDFPETGDGSSPAIITPTGSASALFSVYNPSQLEIQQFGAWLWSTNFVDQLLKLFNDPMQAIIGLHKIFATPTISGQGPIKVGYLSSGVNANLVSDQYTEVCCGTVSLPEYFGNALDYTDTDILLYLPFIGIIDLNPLDVTRADIAVTYHVDVLSGACLAVVNVHRDGSGGQLYTYSGSCSVQYPLSSGSYMGLVTSIATVAGSIAGTIASGGSIAPMAIGASVGALNHMKANIQHSGSISGNAGAMGIKKPYLIVRRPQTKIAKNYHTMDGGSNNVYKSLSGESGFVRVKYIHLENIPATDYELEEIERILKDGVLI